MSSKAPKGLGKSARRRPTLRSGAYEKVHFEIKTRVHDLLRNEAARRETTQVSLLESLIEEHCNPSRKAAVHEPAF